MTALYIVCAFNILSLALFSRARYKSNGAKGFTLKIITSSLFVIVGILASIINGIPLSLSFYIIVALSFGLVGDILLALPEFKTKNSTLYVVLGGCAFLLGHIFYVVYFITFGSFHYLTVIVAFAISIIILTVIRITGLKIDNKKLLPAMLIYLMLISTVVTTAFYNSYKTNFCTASILALIGTFLFLISDICLVYSYFYIYTDKRKISLLVYYTYYPAQILLALSIAFI